MFKKTKVLPIFLSLLLLLTGAVGAAAQGDIQVIDQGWDGEFRDHLSFTVDAQSSAEIVEAELLYQVVGQLATSRNTAEFTPGTEISARYVIDQTEPANYMPPGTEVEYRWSLTDAAGNEFKTEPERLVYLDNRYQWQTLENERLTLYWYTGDDSFGQALYDRANEALDTLQEDVGIGLENPIRIFIYGNHQDLLSAVSTSAQEWTGGQAFAEHGVVVIGIAPRQLEWGLNAMTHEMSHLVIHQATDNPFGGLPRWLDEGIAVYNENRDELDDDFRPVFERAVANNELMTLRTLSSPFPADPLEANLAYGQSGAVVKFIIDTYGTAKMSEMLDIFAEGALYDEALEQSLGVTTDQLDNQFRASLDLSPLPGTEAEAEPAPAVPAESEAATTEETDTAGETASDSAASDGGAVAEESQTQQAEAAIESAPPPADAESESSPLAALPCMAGLLALFFMGGALLVFRAG